MDRLHSGYLLPTTAAALIGAQELARAGWSNAGHAAFAVGLLSWLLIGPMLLARFALRPPSSAQLVPTLAIFSAPPAVAGNAWFALNGGATDLVQRSLLGTFVLLLGVQLVRLPSYARLPFGLGWWAFTFTTAASATYVVQWSAHMDYVGWQVAAWSAATLATGLIGSIAVRSVRLAVDARR